jgi:hypothetical protein
VSHTLRRIAKEQAEELVVTLKLTAREAAAYSHTLHCAVTMFDGISDSEADRITDEEADVLARLAYRCMELADRIRASVPKR